MAGLEGQKLVQAAVDRLLQCAHHAGTELQRLRSENESLRRSLQAVQGVDDAEIGRLWATIEELEVKLALFKQQPQLQLGGALQGQGWAAQPHLGQGAAGGPASQRFHEELQPLIGASIQRQLRDLLLPQLAAEVAACRAARAAVHPPAQMQPQPQRQAQLLLQQEEQHQPQQQETEQPPCPPTAQPSSGPPATDSLPSPRPRQPKINPPLAAAASEGPRPTSRASAQQPQSAAAGLGQVAGEGQAACVVAQQPESATAAKQAAGEGMAVPPLAAKVASKPAPTIQTQAVASTGAVAAEAGVEARPSLSAAGRASKPSARPAAAATASDAARRPSPAGAGAGEEGAGKVEVEQRGTKRPAASMSGGGPLQAQISGPAAAAKKAAAAAEAVPAKTRPPAAAPVAAALQRTVVRAPLASFPAAGTPVPSPVWSRTPASSGPAAQPPAAGTGAALADGPDWKERWAKRAKRFGIAEAAEAAQQPALSVPTAAAAPATGSPQLSSPQPATGAAKGPGGQHLSTADSQFVGEQKNLKERLGGVIFICNNQTLQECQTELLFGLPRQHWCYVQYIRQGMPLFLFNISDRHLHGIYHAASDGGWEINPSGWAGHGGRTAYPCQVRAELFRECPPLSERRFKLVLEPNYLATSKNFLLELSRRQAKELCRLFLARGSKG